MAKPTRPMGSGRDDRPRFHVRSTMDGGVAWRRGVGGLERRARTFGEAGDAALESVQHVPAVFFWEGRTEG